MKEKIKEKMKSWPLWLALGALIAFCAKELAGVDVSAQIDGLLNVLLPVLVGFGVVNNPDSRETI